MFARLLRSPGSAVEPLISSFVSQLHQQSVRLISKKTLKQKIDYSKYPELKESDLQETFCFGWGPGGQAVNKTENCVNLKHIPTGCIVKCHHTRDKIENQKIAREILRDKVDDFLNGENSVANQIKRLKEQRRKQFEAREAKRRELKKKLKEESQKEVTKELASES